MAKFAPFDAADYLDDEDTIAEYITAALEDPNPDVFLAAVRDVARARGRVSELVEDRVDLGQSLHAQHLVVADPIAGLQAGPVGRTDWFHGPPKMVSGRGKRKGSRRDPALPAGGRMDMRGAPTAPRTRPGYDA